MLLILQLTVVLWTFCLLANSQDDKNVLSTSKYLEKNGDGTIIVPTGTSNQEDSAQLELLHYGSQMSITDEEPVMTFERAVVEGSTISLQCPHLTTGATSFLQKGSSQTGTASTTTTLYEMSNGQMDRIGRQQKLHHDPARVKWFKNHVPLLNPNDQQEGELDEPNRALTQTRTRITELNTTIESSQPNSRELEQQKLLPIQQQQQIPNTAASSYTVGLLVPLAGENVNEQNYVRNTIGASKSGHQDAHWQINELGELVINKVSPKFAGKYTCLAIRKQSEVLLDVLLDSHVEEEAQEKVSRIPNTYKRRDAELKRPYKMDGGAKLVKSERIKPNSSREELSKDFDDCSTGNGPIEDDNRSNSSSSSSRLTRNCTSPLNQTSEQNSDKKDNSQVDNNSSAQSDTIRVAKGESKPLRGTENVIPNMTTSVDGCECSVRCEQMFDIDIDGGSRRNFAKAASASKIDVSKLRHYQHYKIHMVESEAIVMKDSKLIPGFLFSKQHLNCPTTLHNAVNREFIYPIIHAFCPSHLKSSMTSQRIREKLKCNQLAECLISKILTSKLSAPINSCHNPLLEVLWFKDGEQLEFDSDGRERRNSSNIKMINLEEENDNFASSKISFEGEIQSNMKEGNSFQNSDTTLSKWTCPPKGNTLEIVGVRKDNEGRYTCALKLSSEKLVTIIRSLKGEVKQIELSKCLGTTRSSPNLSLDKDISCCDGRRSSKSAIISQNEKSSIDPGKILMGQFKTMTPKLSASRIDRFSLRRKKRNRFADGESLIKRIVTLEAILGNTSTYESSMKCMERMLSQQKEHLAIAVQTFTLSVVERAANSSGLWSNIVEADHAYTRRKLTDFRRLRRAIRDRSKEQTTVKATASTTTTTATNILEQLDCKGGNPILNDNSSSGNQLLEAIPEEVSFLVAHTLEPVKWEHTNNVKESRERTKKTTDEAVGVFKEGKESLKRSLEEGKYQERGSSGYDSGVISRFKEEGSFNRMMNHNKHHRRVNSSQLGTDDSSRNNVVNNGAEFDMKVSQILTKEQSESSTSAFNYANNRDQRPTSTAQVANILLDNEVLDSSTRTSSELVQASIDHLSLEKAKTKPKNLMDVFLSSSHRTISNQASSHKQSNGTTFEIGKGFLVSDEQFDRTPVFIINDDASGRSALSNEKRLEYRSELKLTNVNVNQIDSGLTKSDVKRAFVRSDNIGRREREEKQSLAPRVWPSDKSQEFKTLYTQNRQAINKARLEEKTWLPNIGSNPFKDEIRTGGSHSGYSTTDMHIEDLIKKPIHEPLEDNQLTKTLGTPASSTFAETNTPLTSDDKLDDSLIWTTSQFLYMHMKAVASSSLFGVEVEVEWSNENVDDLVLANEQDEETRSGSFKVQDNSPFATIDVISGEYLHLQCTAQALGRLPEVKWYKQIDSIPETINWPEYIRKIDQDLYWRLTEIDLYYGFAKRDATRRFVSSQTTTIFDHLENQTFTVVNTLQLSQYNDKMDSTSDHNLYACIVDADIRQNHVTLGVQLRESPRKNVYNLGHQLQSGSKIALHDSNLHFTKSIPTRITKSSDEFVPFNLYRQSPNHQIELQDYWIPIHNGSFHLQSRNSFPLSPFILSASILLVFGSLIALIYLTMRSYQSYKPINTEANHEMCPRYYDKNDCFISARHKDNSEAQQNTVLGLSCKCQYQSSIPSDMFPSSFYQPIKLNSHYTEHLISDTCGSGPETNRPSCEIHLLEPETARGTCCGDEILNLYPEHIAISPIYKTPQDPTNLTTSNSAINVYTNPLDQTR